MAESVAITNGTALPGAPKPMRPSPHFEAQVQRAISFIAESDCPVLIVGERGVGKRTLAAQLHAQSHRARRSFTEIRSAEADANALQAALSTKGTVYLSEVGDLSLPLQELVLDSYFGGVPASGSRLICGSTRDLGEEVDSWRMSEAFYCMISAVMLRIAPLRCRKFEILTIAEELLEQYARQFGRPRPVLSEEIVAFLLEHAWPDNLAELDTAIKTFVAIGDTSISLAALKAAASNGSAARRPLSLKEASRTASSQIERKLICEVLMANGGNRKRAAGELGISYKALLYKLKQIAGEPTHPRIGAAS